MDQSEEEAAFTIVENWWKKSFEISKNTDDHLFSLYTKSFETIMVYMSQSLDYEYIEKEIGLLDKDRQLALQSENSYDAHRCLSFGIIEAVQIMMKKNTKKLEEMIKQGYIPVPEIPKFPLEPKEEENMDDPQQIPAENEISPSLSNENTVQPIDDVSQDFPSVNQTSPLAFIAHDFRVKEESMVDDDVEDAYSPNEQLSFNDNSSEKSMIPNFTRPKPQGPKEEPFNDFQETPEEYIQISPSPPKEITEQPGDDFSQDFPADDQTPPPALIEKDFHLNEKDMMDGDVNTGMDDFSPEIDNSNNESPLEEEIMDEPNKGTDLSPDQTMKEGRKSTRKVSRPVKHNSMEDSDEEEVEPIMKKTRLDATKKNEKDSSQVKCVLCEVCPKTVREYVKHLYAHHKEKSPLDANGVYLICSCGDEVCSRFSFYKYHNKCDGLGFTVHKKEDKVHSTPQCILCEAYPKTGLSYSSHLKYVHKSTLIQNGIYLLCSCGFEVRSKSGCLKHSKNCDKQHQFSLHKKEDEVHSTPKCILCETFPTTAHGYVNHLNHVHKSTLNSNEIHLLCSCGFKIHSYNSSFNHFKEVGKKCDKHQFSLHKNIPE